MDEHIAALLWTVAEEKRSLVSAAEPRKAGKTTVLHAALEHVPEGTPVHQLSGDIDEIRSLASKSDGGYLEVGEISTEPPARYIWGEPVAVLFDTVAAGFSLATTMHTTGVDDVFKQICVDNGISDASASVIQYVIHSQRFGDDDETYWRRVRSVHEVTGVQDGVPRARQLFSWNEASDRFEPIAAPTLLTASRATVNERAELIRQQADSLQ